MGLLNNVIPSSAIFYTQTHISVSLASIISTMTPVFTFLVLASFCIERLTVNRIVSALIGITGNSDTVRRQVFFSRFKQLGAWFVMDNVLTGQQVFGALVIILPPLVIDGRLFARNQQTVIPPFNTPFWFNSEVQLKLSINAINPLVVPNKAFDVTQIEATQTKSPTRIRRR